ncbi:MAG: DNA polymerase III subunit gamma/tau [Elusimicrobiaceae bacterium]|nr:DNA polymerase III subunit gamma/tau [Elusimicrobiaceae bacterium]
MSENTGYVSLANKYRPQKFEDMVGQESISKTLQNALKLGRIAHAYLFYGPRGCGKTTTARILAKALNCTGHGNDKPTAEPCGECPQCREIAQSGDMDVLELDAASNTQVEKVREAIIERVALASSRDRYKVFILDEVHMLSASSFNALLKTIEEPPAHVIFILATTEKHKVPATIVSRCQTFRFRPITVDEITKHLLELAEAEGLNLTEKAARIIAKNAGGALRDALTLMDRAIAYSDGKIDEKLVGEMLGLTPQDLLTQTITALIQKNSASLHAAFETLRAEGFDANSFLKDVKNALGDLFYFALGQGSAPFDGAEKITALATPGLLAALSRKINKLAEEVKFADNALISAEVGLFTVMDSCFDVEGFIRRLEALERGESTEGALPPPTTPKKETPAVNKTSATASKTTPHISKTQAVAESAKPSKIADNQTLWEKLVQAFKPSIFVYDALTNCTVRFEGDDWNIHFGKGKEFYKVPASNKLTELEKMALKLGGRAIHFTVTANATEQTAAVTAVPTKTVATREEKAVVISTEEPFIKADFSADAAAAVADTKAAKAADALGKPLAAQAVPEEVQGLLDIFGGEVLA